MALFDKGQGQEDKTQKLLARYGLENIDPQYADAVRKIARDLSGSGLVDLGSRLSMDGKANNLAQTQYTKAILEQNFIIIRQLDQIAYLLEQRLQ